jgi:hypothetical protein
MNLIGISNIAITDNQGNPFTVDNYSYFLTNHIIKVSFTVDYGESYINRIQYTLCTKNDLAMYEKIDSNGTSRGWDFLVSGDNGGLYYGENIGDVIYVKIDIENFDGDVFSFNAEKYVPEPLLNSTEKPGFSSISAFQRQDGSQLVEINYDYHGLSSTNSSIISVYFSDDSGDTWSNTIAKDALRGDVGSGVMPGYNRIIWNPVLSFSNVYTHPVILSNAYPNSIEVKLELIDTDNCYNIGVSEAIAVLDLYSPEIGIRKLSLAEEYLIFESSSSSSLDSSSSSSSSSSE